MESDTPDSQEGVFFHTPSSPSLLLRRRRGSMEEFEVRKGILETGATQSARCHKKGVEGGGDWARQPERVVIVDYSCALLQFFTSFALTFINNVFVK